MTPHILQRKEVTVVGRITKPHGYKGLVKIQIEHPGAENIETEWVLLMIDQKPVPFFIESIQTNADTWIVKFEDVDTDNQAMELKGISVAMPSQGLPEEVKSGANALIGYEVLDDQKNFLGKVKEAVDHGFQELILIDDLKGKIFMVPFVEPIIVDISMDLKTVTVNLPEGLLDIN